MTELRLLGLGLLFAALHGCVTTKGRGASQEPTTPSTEESRECRIDPNAKDTDLRFFVEIDEDGWHGFARLDEADRYASAHSPVAFPARATVQTSSGQVVAAEVSNASDSDDHAILARYCYRPDGSLWRVVATHDWNSTGLREEFEQSFTPTGSVEASHYRAIGQNGSDEKDTGWRPPIYARTSELPFRR